jgi:hypothetical protein
MPACLAGRPLAGLNGEEFGLNLGLSIGSDYLTEIYIFYMRASKATGRDNLFGRATKIHV